MKFFKFGKKEQKANPYYKVMFSFAGSQSKTVRNYAGFAKEGYQSNAIIYQCVDKIKTAASQINLCLYQKDSSGKAKELDKHPVLDLLNNPNPTTSRRSFISDILGYKLISGNSYVLKVGVTKPQELWLIPPSKVKITMGDGGIPKFYEVGNAGTRKIPVDEITGQSELLHIKTFNPLDDVIGMSPMEAAIYSIDAFNESQRWNYSLLENGCKPDGALKYTNESASLTDEQVKELRTKLEDYRGSKNASKSMILDGNFEWLQFSLSPKDIDFIKGQLSLALWICGVYGVPPQLIGLPDTSTYANFEQASLSFYENTVLPQMKDLCDYLNRWLIPQYTKNNDLYFAIDEDTIPALQPRRKIITDNTVQLFEKGIITANEARETLGYGKYETGEGADGLYISANQIPIEMASEQADSANDDPYANSIGDNNTTTDTTDDPEDE